VWRLPMVFRRACLPPVGVTAAVHERPCMIGPLFSYFHAGNPNYNPPGGRVLCGQLQAEPEGWYHAALNSNIELGLGQWEDFMGSLLEKGPQICTRPPRASRVSASGAGLLVSLTFE
jgi:hypothetical protein